MQRRAGAGAGAAAAGRAVAPAWTCLHVLTRRPCSPPAAATLPFFGVDAAILDDKGNEVEGPGQVGGRRSTGRRARPLCAAPQLARGHVHRALHTLAAPHTPDAARRRASCAPQGYLVIKRPWPSMMRSVAGDHARFEQTYFSHYKVGRD